jgi:hypothetical protein
MPLRIKGDTEAALRALPVSAVMLRPAASICLANAVRTRGCVRCTRWAHRSWAWACACCGVMTSTRGRPRCSQARCWTCLRWSKRLRPTGWLC